MKENKKSTSKKGDNPHRETHQMRWERRKEMVRLFGEGYPLSNFEQVLCNKYHVSIGAVRRDWTRRNEWLPILARIDDPNFKISEILVDLRHTREAAWETYREAKKVNNQNAMVGAIGRLKELIATEVDILQSLNMLPREPLRIEQRIQYETALEQQKRILAEMDPKKRDEIIAALEPFETKEDAE